MPETLQNRSDSKGRGRALAGVALAAAAILVAVYPEAVRDLAIYIAVSLVSIAPLVIPGIALSAWVTASGASGRVAGMFRRRQFQAIFVASLVGAATPVCGVTVLPLMAALLASGVPLAPVMAFWLSSPVTDPAMFAVTVATLGLHFSVAKTVAAFGIGLFGGLATAGIRSRAWTDDPLRGSGIAAKLTASACGATDEVRFAIWRDRAAMEAFRRECVSIARLLAICLIPAFAAEHLMNGFLHPDSLSELLGSGSAWAIPLSVLVGGPAYVDGYVALPLTRGLMDAGMSPGAAMSFLVSGSVVSVWGAIAILPVLRARPFLLYLGLAVSGSLLAGYGYEALPR